ncbi:MAG: class I SAM-dependent methyltransferase [Parvibaculum sp.]
MTGHLDTMIRPPDGKSYHAHVRRDVFHLLPTKCERVLEIGMGAGGTMAALKHVRQVLFSAGVELDARAAVDARSTADEVLQGDVTQMNFPGHWAEFDVILCLDVLEHLVDPWQMIHRLHALLKPNGVIVASLPNVNYFRVALPLLLRGQWELQDAGVLDRTHLRFFVKKTAIELMTCSGLVLQVIESGGIAPNSRRWWGIKLSGGLLERFLAPQYLIRVGQQTGASTGFRDGGV